MLGSNIKPLLGIVIWVINQPQIGIIPNLGWDLDMGWAALGGGCAVGGGDQMKGLKLCMDFVLGGVDTAVIGIVAIFTIVVIGCAQWSKVAHLGWGNGTRVELVLVLGEVELGWAKASGVEGWGSVVCVIADVVTILAIWTILMSVP